MKVTDKMNKFKLPSILRDIHIKYSNIAKPEFKVNIWGEEFTVEVNKFKPVGADVKAYSAFSNGKVETFVIHEPRRIPDYEKFRYYLHTLLVHNVDSQIANYVCANEDTISIHDAFLCIPGSSVRKLYTEKLAQLRIVGKDVLREYWKSINIDAVKVAMKVVELWKSVEKCELEIEESSLK